MKLNISKIKHCFRKANKCDEGALLQEDFVVFPNPLVDIGLSVLMKFWACIITSLDLLPLRKF